VLTDHERQVLDEITADLETSDPHLAARLGGTRFAFWRNWWRRSQSVTGAVAIPAGLVLAVAVFPFSVWIAFAGVGASFWGCVIHADGAAQLARRGIARMPRPRPSRGFNA
jgi:Protein of unknown function (DUF3040)